MADQNSLVKLYHRVARQRIEDADMETLSRVSQENLDNALWSLLCDFPAILYGLHVGAPAGYDFPISAGAALQDGTLLKVATALSATLADNSGSGLSRTDMIVLNGWTEPQSDPINPRALSALTREEVTSPLNIGTGDGLQKAFDLAHDKVDLKSLKVFVDGVQVGGWNISRETGTSSVDQVLFGTAPASGAITVTYDWINGGVEATVSNQPSRKTYTPKVQVYTGSTTPLGSDVVLAHVTVPPFWAGGSAGVTIDTSVAPILVGDDAEKDPYAPKVGPATGRIGGAIRRIDQVQSGLRLIWKADDKVEVTPGWGNIGGVAYAMRVTKEFSIEAETTGWHYCYLKPKQTSVGIPGSEPTLEVSATPPMANGRESGQVARMYLGPVYVTSTEPITIRKFYTHGDWIYWEDPTPLTIIVDPAEQNLDVGEWLPPTGRLFMARLINDITATSDGSGQEIVVKSHSVAKAKPFPLLQSENYPLAAAGGVQDFQVGPLRAEELEGQRLVHTHRPSAPNTENPNGTLTVFGFIDDYRTMNDSAVPSFY